MNPLTMYLLLFFEWLLRATCQASLLILLVLAIQKAFGRRLGVRGRYCLWLLVLIRMAMPVAVPSRVSVHNLLPLWPGTSTILSAGRVDFAPAPAGSAAQASRPTGAAERPASKNASSPRHGRSARFREYRLDTRTTAFLSLIWVAGACCLTGFILASHVRLLGIVRRGRLITDPRILDLLEECKRLLGTRARVRVIATDRIAGPALFGLVRPRLLLPRETLAAGDRSELRHIFLHELGHHKRRDILIGQLASVLHVLHWFNPLVALGLRRMRADLELACDGMVLSVLGPEEVLAYGRTVIRQIERLLASPWRSVLPGAGGGKTQIRRRIAMISTFGEETYRWSPLALVLVGCLACVGLTNELAEAYVRTVEPPSNPWDAYARRNFRTAHRDKHANILRCCLRNLETGKYLAAYGETVACDAEEPGEAGLWEFRFDEVSNSPTDVMYFYSVATGRYLTSDGQGNLSASTREPVEAARWGAWPHPGGVWLVSHRYKDGYLRLDEQGQVRAEVGGRDPRSYWDVHTVWRVKTSDNPKSNPEWQREKIPGPD